MSTPTTTAPATPPGDAKTQARRARQARATKPAPAAQPKAQPKAAKPAQESQAAPASKPAPAPKAPKRAIFAHVLPVRGKTAITDGKPPAGMLIIESTEETPWEPGAIRLLAVQPGKPLPKGPFHLAHAKSGAWLAQWRVIEKTTAKGLQVWQVTEPAPAATASE